MTKKKIAVVLFNLGGPDKPEAVKPFLFNLFFDPAIISRPLILRWLLAKFISSKREKIAQEIYKFIGGKSPLLENTIKQAQALSKLLENLDNFEFKIFISMRYWHPFSAQVAKEVKDFCPDRVVLLPLYPQFSTTTTGSSFKDWQESAEKIGLKIPTHGVCCYFWEENFIASLSQSLEKALLDFSDQSLKIKTSAKIQIPRILFSAHGLPKQIIEKGDPYAFQIEQTAQHVVQYLQKNHSNINFDWVVCYQSRVGPVEWIGPQTDEEIIRAGKEGTPLIIIPLAFVSEHSETLVELDIEYKKLADEHGVPLYIRVQTPGCDPLFIESLAQIVKTLSSTDAQLICGNETKTCSIEFPLCPLTL